MPVYSENRYAVYKSVVLENNTIGTVDIMIINKLQFLIFFIFLIYETYEAGLGGGGAGGGGGAVSHPYFAIYHYFAIYTIPIHFVL